MKLEDWVFGLKVGWEGGDYCPPKLKPPVGAATVVISLC